MIRHAFVYFLQQQSSQKTQNPTMIVQLMNPIQILPTVQWFQF